MKINLYSQSDVLIGSLNEDERMLGYYPIIDFMRFDVCGVPYTFYSSSILNDDDDGCPHDANRWWIQVPTKLETNSQICQPLTNMNCPKRNIPSDLVDTQVYAASNSFYLSVC